MFAPSPLFPVALIVGVTELVPSEYLSPDASALVALFLPTIAYLVPLDVLTFTLSAEPEV